MLNALVRLSEGELVEEHPGVPPEVYGVVAFLLLLVLLIAVTRFNPDR
jgi:hypothetical protein